MIVANISDMVKGLPEIWGDPEHTQANEKFGELTAYLGKQSAALLSNVFSANLMTSEMFTKMETCLMEL